MKVSNCGVCLQANIMQDRIYKLMWSQLALLLVQASPHYYHLCLKYILHFNPRFQIRFYLSGKSFGVGEEGKKLWQRPTCECQRCKFLEKILKSGPQRKPFQHSGAKIRVFEQNTDFKFGFLIQEVSSCEIPVTLASHRLLLKTLYSIWNFKKILSSVRRKSK